MKEKKGPLKRKIVAFLERLLNPSEGEPENDANNVNEKREREGSLFGDQPRPRVGSHHPDRVRNGIDSLIGECAGSPIRTDDPGTSAHAIRESMLSCGSLGRFNCGVPTNQAATMKS